MENNTNITSSTQEVPSQSNNVAVPGLKSGTNDVVGTTSSNVSAGEPVKPSSGSVSNENKDLNGSPVTQKELNFEALRRSKHEAEQEVVRLRRQLEDRNQASRVKEQSTASEQPADPIKAELESIKKELKQQKIDKKTQAIESRLKKEYKDLDKVLSQDNIEVLKARDPQFAAIISSGQGSPEDLYHRAIAAYSLIKKYGIYIEDNYSENRTRVEENLAKPKPAVTTSGSNTLGEFAEFTNMNTEERRMAIYKKVLERSGNI